MLNAITDVKDLKVGHATDLKNYTGCTVILSEKGFVCTVLVVGSASGTRQIDALFPGHLVNRIYAILLTGCSAFGLDCAYGVMRYLEEKGLGFPVGRIKIPVVPTAVIFDLFFGNENKKLNPEMGYEACLNAKEICEEGSVGAGTGATVGKLFGIERAMKGGVGTSSIITSDALVVGALVVVNAFGDVIDNLTGKIITGLRKSKESLEFENTVEAIKRGVTRKEFGSFNTTLAVLATNGRFTKEELRKIGIMALGGFSKTINPAHTIFDGDILFILSTEEIEADINRVGIYGEFVISEAIKRAVKKAEGFGILPAFKDIYKGLKVV